MLRKELMEKSGTWADANPAVLDTRLRTDDGFLVSDLTANERNFVNDLFTVFKSRVSQRISQRLAATVAWACYVTALVIVGDFIAPDVVGKYTDFQVPNWPHELVGGFLAILIVFRTNQAYERFWEGRKLWADLASSCRSLTVLALEHLPKSLAPEFLAHVAAFPTALKMHLRGYKNEKEIKAIFNTFLGANSSAAAAVICQSNTMPLTILMGISQICAPIRVYERSARLEAVWEMVEHDLNKLTEVMSECEKIKCTPIPLSYSRHTSRFFSLFTFSLPFALVKQTSPLIVPIAVLLVSWVLFATEEIGRVIEEPFGNNKNKAPARQMGPFQPSNEELEMAFTQCDRGQKGYVDTEDVRRELPKLLKTTNDVTEADIKAIVSGLDLDGDGVVQMEEFKIAWSMVVGSVRTRQLEALPLNRYCDMVMREMLYYWGVAKLEAGGKERWVSDAVLYQVMNQTFAEMDQDGSGRIDKEEMRRAMQGYAPDDQISDTFDRLDADGDGELSLKEAVGWRWTDASAWLVESGFPEYAEAFDTNDVDFEAMIRLSERDLVGLGVVSLGKRKMLMAKIRELRMSQQ
eukprot:CAMPEP_0206249278 /NCGR_PEP_ID=MMETSP0047_2-20121206/20822_1 /ASSEMBLY_ACC=CAM_ASM_000192 /TAXON_ID=195065 /ORGANISM="Chroomonas mesostigmatica_cf, Strain CCMP1168" /LENGTH=576 /DNA_ID=CAMNT_0053674987 /DNA_START=1 /DNA_END=1728 /DNA_ORIENTATION=+